MCDEVFCQNCGHCIKDNDFQDQDYFFCDLDMENFTLDDSIECENFECNNEE